VHVMEDLGEFHKSTRRGDFVKIFENVHKMEHFQNFLHIFQWENRIHENYTHIFSTKQCSESIESTPPPKNKISGASRRKCAQSGENPITRTSPQMCIFWSDLGGGVLLPKNRKIFWEKKVEGL
jgi:hypothetical protein